jgi:hypothetical protein
MRLLSSFVVLVCLSVLGGALPGAGSSAWAQERGALTGQWREYRPAGQGFRVILPGVPLLKDTQVQTGYGPVIKHEFIIGSDDVAYNLSYADFPASAASQPAAEMLQNVRTGEIGKNRLRREWSLTVSGAPARRVITDPADGNFVMQSLIVVQGVRVYQAIYTVRPRLENQADIDRFMNSFALLPR